MGTDLLSQTKPIPIPTQEEDHSSHSRALLSFNTDSPSDPAAKTPPSKPNTTIIFIALILFTCIALQLPLRLLFSFTRLLRPLFQLQLRTFLTSLPNIHRLIANGTEADLGLIPVFPTLTFPNHYSIVTGLYPAYHGVINNRFVDPNTGEVFTMSSHEPKWWLGEPLWETGQSWFKGFYLFLAWNEIPVFMTLYFEDPDHQGHQVGPDDPQITEAVARIDSLIGRLIDGLEKRGVFEDVTIIMVGDHGMVGTCDKKLIFLDDLAPWIKIPADWVQYYTPMLAIRPLPSHAPSDFFAKMNEGLEPGKVENGKYLKVYLKEELPSRLHYAASGRIPPIIGLIEESFKGEQKRTKRQECGGAHGYDNAFFSMRTIFIGHGPQFARGKKVPSFENVQIYNLVTSILKLEGAPNNGSSAFPESVLLLSQ
ncbi:hypothetical protein F3Y22_tig00112490pilonHSYRG00004 [Hibiscus syriacus]|uniref:Ectonucleotide pyrophosphatase/phosphodiesterase family member 3 n=1 Tax=Hibiscus syriacus TaxID=106335 RepID=A0A6A2XBM5_HIBSY|nr:hypothetical protein F3Y22_tig00112490pilonHSYRG00004 [Hibiscus syriacus]